MFIWIDKQTSCGIGFSATPSIDPAHLSIQTDEQTFKELTGNPNKIRWARLVKEGREQVVKFLLPAPVKTQKVLPLRLITRAEGEPCIRLSLSKTDELSIACKYAMPENLFLVVCAPKINEVLYMIPLNKGHRFLRNLRKYLLPPNRVFLSGVPTDWDADFLLEEGAD